jgi:hypothetical protein
MKRLCLAVPLFWVGSIAALGQSTNTFISAPPNLPLKQVFSNPQPALPAARPNPGLIVTLAGTNLGHPFVLLGRTNQSPVGGAVPLKPGTYLSVPYSCLILVPPPGLDDKSLIPFKGTVPPMPTIIPDVRFIPYPTSK